MAHVHWQPDPTSPQTWLTVMCQRHADANEVPHPGSALRPDPVSQVSQVSQASSVAANQQQQRRAAGTNTVASATAQARLERAIRQPAPPEFLYRLLLGWNEQRRTWTVQVPELPGAFAMGATPDVAVADAQEAIRQWRLDAQRLGMAIPKPYPPSASAAPVPPAGSGKSANNKSAK